MNWFSVDSREREDRQLFIVECQVVNGEARRLSLCTYHSKYWVRQESSNDLKSRGQSVKTEGI